MITVRREEPGDVKGIREVNLLAFGQPQEADVADKLRGNPPKSCSDLEPLLLGCRVDCRMTLAYRLCCPCEYPSTQPAVTIIPVF